MQSAVETLDILKTSLQKDWNYCLTTNGSLIDESILSFLGDHHFRITLSFDGYCQDIQREPGTFHPTVTTIRTILNDQNLTLETNTVCTPDTVNDVARSIRYIAELGVPEILLSFSNLHPWVTEAQEHLKQELESLRFFFLDLYKKTRKMPFQNFRPGTGSGRFVCTGGRSRMALAQDGSLWGCYMFPEFFKQVDKTERARGYCYGKFDDFIESPKESYSKITANYSRLHLDRCVSDRSICMLCPDIEACTMCPVSAAFSSRLIGKIPDWMCSVRKLIRDEKELFLDEIGRPG